MKKVLISLVTLAFWSVCLNAQNIAFVNTETILKSIPEYTAAQEYLNNLSEKYKAALEQEIEKIDVLYQNYQKNKASMPVSQRIAAEEEIISKEKVVKEKQNIYFGEDGIMYKKSEELLSPIKKKVDAVIESIINVQGGVDLVIDLAANQGMVYYNKSRDLTEKVMETYKKLYN